MNCTSLLVLILVSHRHTAWEVAFPACSKIDDFDDLWLLQRNFSSSTHIHKETTSLLGHGYRDLPSYLSPFDDKHFLWGRRQVMLGDRFHWIKSIPTADIVSIF